MREAVELVEAVERTGRVYAYGENYCYMPAPREMRRLYREGVIGEFEYGEGEYVHNCEPIWPVLTGGDPDHWRNGMYATFYCTHSIGPLLHITGLRPVRVTGFEGTKTERKVRCGAKGGSFGMELIELGSSRACTATCTATRCGIACTVRRDGWRAGAPMPAAGCQPCMSAPTAIPGNTPPSGRRPAS